MGLQFLLLDGGTYATSLSVIDLTYPFKYGKFSSVLVAKNLTNGCTRLVKKTWMHLRNYFSQIFQKYLFEDAYKKKKPSFAWFR